MVEKLSFQDLQMTCQALGDFAAARTRCNSPDKDFILTVTKIQGRPVLQTIRLSTLPWFSRLVRWLGLGGSTLKAVVNFLTQEEPYIPSSFSGLKDRDVLGCFYTEEAMNHLATLDKGSYQTLKKQKIKGYEVIKNCVTHHNARRMQKVYLLFKEYEKTYLTGGYNPMGLLDRNCEAEEALVERYRAPLIDENQFPYVEKFFLRVEVDMLTSNALGFCYEYGLGTSKNRALALEHYHTAAARGNEYSACYNQGRLLLEDGEVQEAIESFRQGEDLLLAHLGETQNVLDYQRYLLQRFRDLGRDRDIPRRERVVERELDLIKKYNKALHRVYEALIRAYARSGNDAQKQEYERKLAQQPQNT